MNRGTLKFAFFLLGATAFTLLSSCGLGGLFDSAERVDNTNSVAEDTFSFTLAVTNQTRFRLEGINGNIQTVGSADGDSVFVSGVKQVGSESLVDAASHLPELQVQITDLGDEFRVETVQPRKTQGRNYVINYEITLPRSFVLSADNINGNLWISKVDSGAVIGNINGNIQLTGITGTAPWTS